MVKDGLDVGGWKGNGLQCGGVHSPSSNNFLLFAGAIAEFDHGSHVGWFSPLHDLWDQFIAIWTFLSESRTGSVIVHPSLTSQPANQVWWKTRALLSTNPLLSWGLS